jgi:hypothetical protein
MVKKLEAAFGKLGVVLLASLQGLTRQQHFTCARGW